MISPFTTIIRRHCRPMEPIPTDVKPVLHAVAGIRAVLFDIYGTLLISASGDIDWDQSLAKGHAMVETLAAIGIDCAGDGDACVQCLLAEIAAEHARLRQSGVDFPEVDIVEIWRRAVNAIIKMGLAHRDSKSASTESEGSSGLERDSLRQLALEYEVRVNPVWPMPHAQHCLGQLHRANLVLGVISNSQFLTMTLCRSLHVWEPNGEVFDEDLQFLSYRHGRAKPGTALYAMAADRLTQRGISARETLYIGNDMLNDVVPAYAVGFRTALFAGDSRSLRERADDPRITGTVPDLVITDLSQLPKCLGSTERKPAGGNQ